MRFCQPERNFVMKKEKHFFDSPAKVIISIICIIPLLAIFIAGIVFIVSIVAKNSSIGAEGARSYAFADAGIQPSAAHAVHTEFEFDDWHFVYEVSFFANNTEYEYVIKASDGTILEREPYILPKQEATQQTEAPVTSEAAIPDTSSEIASGTISDITTSSASDTASGTASYIDVEEAKSIAADHAGFSVSDVVFTKIELEQEGLQMVYEIEFCKGTTEYEYEIHAKNGTIIKYDVDLFD